MVATRVRTCQNWGPELDELPRPKRILLTGADGLVGRAVRARARSLGIDLVAPARGELDVTDARARELVLDRERPDAVLFCAAFTAVDRCAGDARSIAVNVEAPAAWAARVETWWLSSNFVFHTPGPHSPGDPPAPEGVYARQKAAGEAGVRAVGGHVVRVGWVWGAAGRTFASGLAARLRRGETVGAISDVVVQPTWSEDLAEALLEFPRGVSHLIGSGEATWYDFARAVAERVGTGAVVPVLQDALALTDPRPRDGRLQPATLAPWWERVEVAASL